MSATFAGAVVRRTLINATPHEIVFHRADGAIIRIPASGILARAETTTATLGEDACQAVAACDDQEPVVTVMTELGLVPMVATAFGALTGLPEPRPDVGYIVSAVAYAAGKSATPPRHDLYMVAETVRDAGGRIVGFRALAI